VVIFGVGFWGDFLVWVIDLAGDGDEYLNLMI
jgi:hypothetical protein